MSNFPAMLNLPLVSIEKPRTYTYLGARAVVTVEHHNSRRVGLRTITMEWIDDAAPENGGWPASTVTRKTVRGDGRRADFEVIVPEAVVA